MSDHLPIEPNGSLGRNVMDYLTTEELAEVCRTVPGTVRYWHHIGSGPRSVKVGRRRLYDRADVEAWLAEQKAAAS
jgi:excisionase family DNA binding protein